MIMGKLFYLPCRDYYEEYEDYYGEENYLSENEIDQDYGISVARESRVRGFVRKCLMFVLIRL